MKVAFNLFCILLFGIALWTQRGCVGVSRTQTYNYASDNARSVCSDSCPGQKCMCILGTENTWYISPEVGE